MAPRTIYFGLEQFLVFRIHKIGLAEGWDRRRIKREARRAREGKPTLADRNITISREPVTFWRNREYFTRP